jgi:hypothetical protein
MMLQVPQEARHRAVLAANRKPIRTGTPCPTRALSAGIGRPRSYGTARLDFDPRSKALRSGRK